MIKIYLNRPGSQIPFLSIPLGDVLRLSIRPFKWLRYVMFSICGARGELSAGPEGPVVDYETTALVDDNIYYYNTSELCHFIDYQGLNDRDTATIYSDQSSGGTEFRDRILERDGSFCVVTEDVARHCDAAHLIPGSKTDGYIQRVVEDRSPIYGNMAQSIRSIDAVENGVLLSNGLHACVGEGSAAFLKTPNYGLEASDIRRANIQRAYQGPTGPTPTDTFTMHQLKERAVYKPELGETLANAGNLLPAIAIVLGLNVDAKFQDTNTLPHPIILDYVYGITAYALWSDGGVHSVMKSYQQQRYTNIIALPPNPPRDDDGYRQRHHTPKKTRHGRAETMDELNLVLMRLSGITPEEAAERWEKQTEEEELKMQEDSRTKVMEWMKTTDVSYNPLL